MSVSLYIYYYSCGCSVDYAIADISRFHRYWLKTADELGLENLQELRDSASYLIETKEDAERILAEIITMKDHLLQDTESVDFATRRVEPIIESIQKALSNWDDVFHIVIS